ncbi:MAG: PH domain-containing protein [Acidimicrobiales bacterium]
MAFPRQLLNDNEDIVLDLRPHWLFMALSTAVFVGVLLLGILAVIIWNPTGFWDAPVNWLSALIGFVAALVWVVLTYLRWVNTHFVLTTDRIINNEGIVRKRGVDIPLDRVNTVIFHQSLLERMLGAGDLIIESASETSANNFKNVRKPNIVRRRSTSRWRRTRTGSSTACAALPARPPV